MIITALTVILKQAFNISTQFLSPLVHLSLWDTFAASVLSVCLSSFSTEKLNSDLRLQFYPGVSICRFIPTQTSTFNPQMSIFGSRWMFVPKLQEFSEGILRYEWPLTPKIYKKHPWNQVDVNSVTFEVIKEKHSQIPAPTERELSAFLQSVTIKRKTGFYSETNNNNESVINRTKSQNYPDCPQCSLFSQISPTCFP